MTRILVVEDERVIAAGLRDNLEVEGYEVEVDADGVEAESRAREGELDLILLDIMLPGKDGLSVLPSLRAAGLRRRSSSSRRRDRKPTRSPASSWARTTTSPSRSASGSCWRG